MPNDTLGIALDCLKQHPNWYLFPIAPLQKSPPCFDNNLELASNDPAQIRRWRAQNFGCNWGVSLKKSKLICVDVDRKPGKVGGDSLDALELERGVLPDTLTVLSPSGGLHLYFDEANGVKHQMRLNAFGQDIDSTNYTLIPGCTLKADEKRGQYAGTYTVVNPARVASAPKWFADYLGDETSAAVPDADQVPAIEQDTKDIVSSAIEYLKKDAKPAIQGQNGEFTLLMVFATLKDMGLSRETAVELVIENYNERCEPPWEIGEGAIADRLDAKATNAWNYLKDTQPGAASSQVAFNESIPQEDIDNIEAAQKLSASADETRRAAIWGEAKNKTWDEWAQSESERKRREASTAKNADDQQDAEAAEAQTFSAVVGDWEEEYEPEEVKEIDPEIPAPTDADVDPEQTLKSLALKPLPELNETVKPPAPGEPGVEQGEGLKTLCQLWVWVTGIERFVNRMDPSVRWSRRQFESEFNYLVKGTSVVNVLFKRKDLLRRFRGLCYRPGAPEIATTVEYNIWRPSPTELLVNSDPLAAVGDTTVWNEHINYLFQNETDAKHVLDWMAWVLQNPDKKPNHALLIVGKSTGTGKSLVATIFEQLIGVQNTQRPKNSSMGGDFNAWLLNCRLCILEEVYQPGRLEKLVSMRDIITESRVEVNIKGISAFPIDNYVSIMGVSNHPDALPLDKYDRRWLVVETFVTRKDRDYYEPLFDLARGIDKAGLSAIYSELLMRDLKGYSGYAAAPETKARAQMIELSRDDAETWLLENSGNMPLARNVVQVSDIVAAMPSTLQRTKRLSTTTIPNFLKDNLRGERYPQMVYLSNGTRAYLWVLHGKAAIKMSGAELAKVYESERRKERVVEDNSAKADFGESEAE